MEKDKLPPQNLTAEQSVLGAMLIDKNAIPRVVEILRPDSFYRDAHRFIFESILKLFDLGEPVDSVTVSELLKKEGRLDAVGGGYTRCEIDSFFGSRTLKYCPLQ